jgi:hypothetical protein
VTIEIRRPTCCALRRGHLPVAGQDHGGEGNFRSVARPWCAPSRRRRRLFAVFSGHEEMEADWSCTRRGSIPTRPARHETRGKLNNRKAVIVDEWNRSSVSASFGGRLHRPHEPGPRRHRRGAASSRRSSSPPTP